MPRGGEKNTDTNKDIDPGTTGDDASNGRKKPKKFYQYGNRSNRQNQYYGKNRYHSGNDRRYYTKKPRFDVGEKLKETDLGITEYVGNAEGFTGTIKERFSDFIVHEIGSDMEIAKLSNQTIPPEPEDLENLEDLKKKVPGDVWEKLQKITEDFSGIEIDVTEMDRDQRRCIHQIVKKLTSVVSETKDVGNKKYITFSKKYPGSRSQDSRTDWSARGGDFCHFILHKVNMDTMDALNQIARIMRLKSTIFQYAGTKDRRAKTTQWISVKKFSPRKIMNAARAVRGAYVGNFKFEKESLKLGKLYGNRFTITLRNITVSDDIIEKAMVSIRDNGYINYYGLQRFGSIAAIPTHEIGKALLKADWTEAVDLILKPREGEGDKNLSEARQIYKETKDSRLAYQKIGRNDKLEAKLLWGLNIHGHKNLQGALDMVPRNTMLMYIHAYQSYVWNSMVSRRIKEFGLKPIVGDLVYENPDNKDADVHVHDDLPHETDDEAKDKSESDSKKEKTSEPNVKKDDLEKTSDTEQVESQEHKENLKNDDDKNSEKDYHEKPLPMVKILTEADLSNYTIFDIIMPQPGWKVTYPTYAKSWFEERLETDGLTPDLKQKNKKYTLSGQYRKILQMPENLSWKIIRFNNRNEDLVLSDIDEIHEYKAAENIPDGQFKALVVQMSLQSSSYATMALREVLKCDTSTQTHAAQSAAAQAEHEKNEEAKSGDKENSETIQKSKDSNCADISHSTEDESSDKKANFSTLSSALEDSSVEDSKSHEKVANSTMEEKMEVNESDKSDLKPELQKHEVDAVNDSGIEPGTLMSA